MDLDYYGLVRGIVELLAGYFQTSEPQRGLQRGSAQAAEMWLLVKGALAANLQAPAELIGDFEQEPWSYQDRLRMYLLEQVRNDPKLGYQLSELLSQFRREQKTGQSIQVAESSRSRISGVGAAVIGDSNIVITGDVSGGIQIGDEYVESIK